MQKKQQNLPDELPSSFKTCLDSFQVPDILFDGVRVIKVTSNGKTRNAFLTLSPDKFTIYISTRKINSSMISSSSKNLTSSASASASATITTATTINTSTNTSHMTVSPSSSSSSSPTSTNNNNSNHMISKNKLLRPILRKVTSIGSGGGSTDDDTDQISTFDVASICRIQPGQTTVKFEMARKMIFKQLVQQQSSPSTSIAATAVSSQIQFPSSISPRKNISSNGNSMIPLLQHPHGDILDVNLSFSIIHSTSRTVDFVLILEDPTWQEKNPFLLQQDKTHGRKMDSPMKTDHSTMKPEDLFGQDSSCHKSGYPSISRDSIIHTLEQLVSVLSRSRLNVSSDIYILRYYWSDVDKDKSDTLNVHELSSLLERINFYKKRNQLDDEYNKFTKLLDLSRAERKKGLTFDQCATFLHKIKRDTWQVKPVQQLWISLFGEFMNNGKPRTRVSADSFLRKFLRRKQGDRKSSMEDVEYLFKALNKLEIANIASHSTYDDQHIDKDRFEAYLFSCDNDIFNPVLEEFDESSLNRPLSEYWINSSHNTYLTGDQLYSRSSVETYYSALHRGVRCLEIDCWDGDRDYDQTPIPIVYHGHTMTSKIPFSEIIEAINDFLTQNPDCLPLILSLENHCSIPFQEMMAKHLIDIFGKRLYVPSESSLQESLPSPLSLRGMVLIKGRRLLESQDDEQDLDQDEDLLEDDDSVLGVSALPDSVEGLEPTRLEGLDTQSVNSKISDSSSIMLAPELSRITLFHRKKGLKDFMESAISPTFHMHSFVETKVRSLCRRRDNSDWIMFNKHHITRTYPSGKRVDSSNYSPIPAWSMGCQMVALNTQHPDYALHLNDGRFRQNGGCGYVLKPSIPHGKDATTLLPWIVSIRVLSGACIPKPKGDKKGKCIDPYVKVSLHDIPVCGGNEIVTSFSTNYVSGNGYFPIWNLDAFTFKVENAQVAMLQFSVYDKDVNEFIAGASIPFTCLRVGYRSVRLFDSVYERKGPFSCASLLVEVSIRATKEC